MGEIRNAYDIFVGKKEEPLGRPKRRWDGYVRMELREMGWEDVDWIHVGQDRDQRLALVNAPVNLRFL
jgi:hypothetical protein